MGGRGSSRGQINAESHIPNDRDQKVMNENYFGTLNFSKVNTALRNGEEKSVKEIIEVIDKNMRPLGKEITVQRYVNDTYMKAVFGKGADNIELSEIKGLSKTEKGYMSTSTQQSKIPYCAIVKTKMIIDIPKGTKALFERKNKGTEYDEYELLIHRGAKYKVKDFRKSTSDDSNYVMRVSIEK